MVHHIYCMMYLSHCLLDSMASHSLKPPWLLETWPLTHPSCNTPSTQVVKLAKSQQFGPINSKCLVANVHNSTCMRSGNDWSGACLLIQEDFHTKFSECCFRINWLDKSTTSNIMIIILTLSYLNPVCRSRMNLLGEGCKKQYEAQDCRKLFAPFNLL